MKYDSSFYLGIVGPLVMVLILGLAAGAQTPSSEQAVPRTVNYSGVAIDTDGKAARGIMGATFAIYTEQSGGSPLWTETQNVSAGANGKFAVVLGATKTGGLPRDVFSTSQARWLGITFNGGEEQPRVALLSVPYALKAADAETLGGLPASAFVTTQSSNEAPAGEVGSANSGRSGRSARSQASLTVTTPSPGGTTNYVPLWTGASTVGNSVISQKGTSVSIAGALTTSGQGFFDGTAIVPSAGVAASNADPNNGAVEALNWSSTGLAIGVEAQSVSPTGIGVFGNVGGNGSGSTTFENHAGYQPIGVVGDAGNTLGLNPIGVWGVADAGIGVVSENSSSTQPAALFLNFDPTAGDLAFEAEGTKGHCYIDTKGDLVCTGSKSAAVALPDNRWVRLYAVESPDNWFEDFGSATLVNGSAEVSLDPTFAQTVNANVEYHVFPVPRGDCKGLYVGAQNAGGFVVRELGGGTSNITFDYRIVARRKGYENVRLEDVTSIQTKIAATNQQLMKSNGAKVQIPELTRARAGQ